MTKLLPAERLEAGADGECLLGHEFVMGRGRSARRTRGWVARLEDTNLLYRSGAEGLAFAYAAAANSSTRAASRGLAGGRGPKPSIAPSWPAT